MSAVDISGLDLKVVVLRLEVGDQVVLTAIERDPEHGPPADPRIYYGDNDVVLLAGPSLTIGVERLDNSR